MPYFESFDKTRLYYESYKGNLPYTLIILHGWGVGCVELYRAFLGPLSCFNLFMWDARSHGKSEVRENTTITDIACDLRFFLTNIYKENYPVIAIGHSMGAMTLFEYVSHYGTDPISKMVIIDQSPKLVTDKEWKLGIFGNLPDEINEEMIRVFYSDIIKGLIFFSGFFLNKEFNQSAAVLDRFFSDNAPTFTPEASRGLANLWKSFTAKDFRPFLPRIDVPTLLLYGAKSQFYLPQTGEYMQTNIPNSRLIMFPQGDHSPFVAHPDEFFQNIKEFVLE